MMPIEIYPVIDYLSPWKIERFRTMRGNQSLQN